MSNPEEEDDEEQAQGRLVVVDMLRHSVDLASKFQDRIFAALASSTSRQGLGE